MKRLLLLLLFPTLALAQTVPNGGITQGQVWSVPQWTTAWQSKADTASPALTGTPTVGGIAIPTYPQTAAELAATITPSNYTFPAGNVLRYGADSTGLVSASTALTNACAASQNPYVPYGTSGSYLLNTAPTQGKCIFQIEKGVVFSGAGSSGTVVNGVNLYGNFGLGTGVEGLYAITVQGHGDNATFRGVKALTLEARDDAATTALNKGVLYALSLSVVPTVGRSNVPFDDVDALTISNTTGVSTAKGTDGIYFSPNASVFGSTNSAWFCLICADANSDVGIALNGRLGLRGIDLSAANIVTAVAIRLGNTQAIYSRNAANTGDVPLLGLDANNVLNLGGTNVSGVLVKNWFGLTAPVNVSTATYTVGFTDNYLIETGAALTITLPGAGSFPGRVLKVKTTANTMTSASANVVPLAGGAAGTAILAGVAGKWAELVSDGVSWQTMSAN